MQLCQPESKKTSAASQKRDKHTVEEIVKNEMLTLRPPSAFPFAFINPEMRPNSESAADGQRPESNQDDRELFAPASKDNLTLSITGQGNI